MNDLFVKNLLLYVRAKKLRKLYTLQPFQYIIDSDRILLSRLCVKKNTQQRILHAIENEDIIYLRLFRNSNVRFNKPIYFTKAVEVGNKKILDFLYENNCPWSKDILAIANEIGNFDTIEFLCEKGCEWDWRVIYSIINNTNIEQFETIEKYIPIPKYILVITVAAAYGNLEMFKYLYTHGYSIDISVTYAAIRSGNIELVKHIFEKSKDFWCNKVIEVAATTGNVKLVQYLESVGCTHKKNILRFAACSGNVEIVKYFQSYKYPLDDCCIMYKAAEHNNFELVKYLYENGCPFHPEVINVAAENNNLEIIRYLHENGCPWESYLYYKAIKHGSLDVVKYAYEHKCPIDQSYIDFAKQLNATSILDYFREVMCIHTE